MTRNGLIVGAVRANRCSGPSSGALWQACGLLAAAAMLAAPAVARADSVTQLGALAVNADSATTMTFNFATVDPTITEGMQGEWTAASTIVLTAPANFIFNTGSMVTATIANDGGLDLGSGAGVAQSVAPTSSTITFTVNAPSTMGGGASITFSGIELRADNGTMPAAGNASDITVTTSAGTLNNAPVVDVTVTPGAANKVVFNTQPTTTAAGATIASFTVRVLDQFNNLLTSDNSTVVSMAIGTNPGGGTLSGTVMRTAASGVATFNNLSINKTGTGYTLVASSGGLTMDTSSTFNITPGAASKLVFGTQPTSAVAGATISPAITVQILDANDNLVTTDNSSVVTMAIQTNPGSGTLSGTTMRTASAGVATFNDLSINKTGTGYTLRPTSGALSTVDSSAFNITPGAANKLGFGVQPTNTAAAASISPAVTVQVQDVNGNVVTSDNSTMVTMSILNNAGGGVLSGTLTQTAASGTATFNNLSINKTGTGYTLQATAGGLVSSGASSSFNITPGAPAELVFGVQPSNTVAGASITPAVTVIVRDANQNIATNDNSTMVTIAIQNNPGSGTLSGTLTRTVASGVATFNNLSINKTGTGYTLLASSGALTTATSNTFNITPGAASKVAFQVQPSNSVANATITPAVTVQIRDVNDNLVTSDNATIVTMAIQNNPNAGTLSGTLMQTASAGVATFNDLSIDKSGTGYTLRATAGGLTMDTSSAFNIAAAAPAALRFVVQPSNTAAGVAISPAVTAEVLDASMNRVTTDNSTVVTIAILNNPGAGTLSGTLMQTAASGVATFNNLSINKVGTGYTLRVTSGALTADTSSAFNITPGAAAKLLFNTQPSNTVAGMSIAPAVTVRVFDANDNLRTNDNSTVVTLAIQTNPGGGTLSGTTMQTAASGVATFNNLSINKTGVGYTLQATSSGLLPDTSSAFNITPGALASLVFVQEPTNTATLSVINQVGGGVIVELRDANANPVTVGGNNVTMAIQNNPGGGVLGGTALRAASAVTGRATFDDLSIDKPGQGYTLRASSGGFQATSSAFDVAPGTNLAASGTVSLAGGLVGFSYTVEGALTVNPFDVAIRLDHAPYSLTPGAEDVLLKTAHIGVAPDSNASDLVPGVHTKTFDLTSVLAGQFANGDRIVIQLDSGNVVVEGNETDNVAASNNLEVDLVVIAVALTQSPFQASVNYTVTSPVNVAPFKIRLTTGSNTLIDLDGDPTPGPHTTPQTDLTAALAAAGVVSDPVNLTQITATIDPNNAVSESDEVVNNSKSNAVPFQVDVAASAITFPLGTSLDTLFDANISYTVGLNVPSQSFAIAVYVSSNQSPLIGTGDKLLQLLTVPNTEKGLGSHTLTARNLNVAASLGFSADFVLKARVDATGDARDICEPGKACDVGNINELSENNNVVVGPNVIDIGLDTDGDGLTDAEELRGFVVTRYSTGANGRRVAESVRVFTDPRKADTDGDGISDFDEVVTFARQAGADGSVPLGGGQQLEPVSARAGLKVFGPGMSINDLPATDFRRDASKFPNGAKAKPIWGVRTDPTKTDTDDDGLLDPDDPAPQINPLRFGFPTALNAAQQALLLSFDQDRDGFLEAPDTNGDVIPDFTQYTEPTIEQAFGIDFSNNGDLLDGFDIGGLNQGPADPNGAFGTYRVLQESDGRVRGDGVLDTLDSTGKQIPIDNCSNVSNPKQGDFDGDGLGDACDADLDNDGIPNILDPIAQGPRGFQLSPLCGLGTSFAVGGAMLGIVAMRRRPGGGHRRVARR